MLIVNQDDIERWVRGGSFPVDPKWSRYRDHQDYSSEGPVSDYNSNGDVTDALSEGFLIPEDDGDNDGVLDGSSRARAIELLD